MKKIKTVVTLLLMSLLVVTSKSVVFADANNPEIERVEKIILEDGTVLYVEIFKPEVAPKMTRGFNESVTLKADVRLGNQKIGEVTTFVDYYALSDGSRGINNIDVLIRTFGEWNDSYYKRESSSKSKWSYYCSISNRKNSELIAQVSLNFNVSVQSRQVPRLSLSK